MQPAATSKPAASKGPAGLSALMCVTISSCGIVLCIAGAVQGTADACTACDVGSLTLLCGVMALAVRMCQCVLAGCLLLTSLEADRLPLVRGHVASKCQHCFYAIRDHQ